MYIKSVIAGKAAREFKATVTLPPYDNIITFTKFMAIILNKNVIQTKIGYIVYIT